MLDDLKKEILCNVEECSEKDFEKVLSEMQKILSLCHKARREGILALEDGLDELKNEDLQFFLQLVVNGIDPELVEEYAINSFYVNKRTTLDMYLFYISVCGALYIQQGMSPYIIAYMFQSILPHSLRHKISDDTWYQDNGINPYI